MSLGDSRRAKGGERVQSSTPGFKTAFLSPSHYSGGPTESLALRMSMRSRCVFPSCGGFLLVTAYVLATELSRSRPMHGHAGWLLCHEAFHVDWTLADYGLHAKAKPVKSYGEHSHTHSPACDLWLGSCHKTAV